MLKRPFFGISPVKNRALPKTCWAWLYSFETQNKQNAFLPFILKEHGSKNIKWKDRAKTAIFRNFTCISEPKKRVWPCALWSGWILAWNFLWWLFGYRSNKKALTRNYLRKKSVFWTALMCSINQGHFRDEEDSHSHTSPNRLASFHLCRVLFCDLRDQ